MYNQLRFINARKSFLDFDFFSLMFLSSKIMLKTHFIIQQFFFNEQAEISRIKTKIINSDSEQVRK